jgi:hypothetical protein
MATTGSCAANSAADLGLLGLGYRIRGPDLEGAFAIAATMRSVGEEVPRSIFPA